MKLAIATILSVLVFSAAGGAGIESKDRWVGVEGGSWVPPAETIARIKEKIESFVRAQAKRDGRELREWKSYTFQYQGQKEHTKKFVFINAFCVSDSTHQLSKQLVLVLDGGTCFFNVKYDPKKKQFFELLINGEA